MNSLALFFLLLLACTQNILAAPRIDGDATGPVEDAEGEELTPNPEEETEEVETPTPTPTEPILVPPPSAGLSQDKPAGAHAQPQQASKHGYRTTVKIWPNSLQEKSDFDIKEPIALCYDNQFDLNLHLSAPFNGYIYPYHHFKTCHLLAGAGDRAVSLRINQNSCGMDVSHGTEEGILSFVQYTMMLQWDKDVIGKWDRKIQVTCNRKDTDSRILVFNAEDSSSNPHLNLEIETQSEDESDNGESVGYDIARVGETVDVSVTLLSSTDTYDVRVVSCSAFDGLRGADHILGTYNINSTSETTYDGRKDLYKDGCPTDKKWLSAFEKQKTGFKTVLSSSLKVFRFPSSGIVVFTCNVQVCEGNCQEADCDSKLEEDKTTTPAAFKEVTLFRPIMVRLGAGMPNDHGHDEMHSAQSFPTASFVAGLIGMGFVCAIVCVFMYRRFKKGSEKDYKMQYNVEKNKDEVAPLKVTTAPSAE